MDIKKFLKPTGYKILTASFSLLVVMGAIFYFSNMLFGQIFPQMDSEMAAYGVQDSGFQQEIFIAYLMDNLTLILAFLALTYLVSCFNENSMEKRKEPVKIRVDLAKPKNLAIAFFALFIIFSVIFYSQAGFIGVEANIVTNAIIPSALVSLGLTGFAHQYLSLAKKINKKIAIEKTGQMANTK